MSKGSNVYFKLYIADWDSDTRHLTTTEDGAYGRLIRYYYRQQEAPPDNEDMLQRITGLKGKIWKEKKAILAKFFQVRDGFWFHKRCEEEIALSKEVYQKKIEAGKTKKLIPGKAGTEFLGNAKVTQPIEKQGDDVSICSAHASQSESESNSYIKNIAKEEKYIKRRNSNSEIIDRALKIYNSIAVQYGGVICKVLNPIKQAKLLKRIEDAKGIDMFETILNEAVQHSQFLQGKIPPSDGHKQFRLSIDFICQEDGFNKIMNGNYNDQEPAGISRLPSQNRNYSNNKSGSFVEAIFNRLAG